MGKVNLPAGWLRYDPVLDLIEVDVTDARADSTDLIDAIFDALEALARAHPDRYVLACWQGVEIAPSVVAHYGERTARLLLLVRQVIRYGANDPITRSIVRTEAIRHVAAGVRSNLYVTRAAALAALAEERARGRSKPPSA